MFYFSKNLLKSLAFFFIIQASYLFSASDADFFMAGYAGDIDIYNIRATGQGNGGLQGGFMIVGEELEYTYYECQIKFDDGGWFYLNGTGTNGGDDDNGTVFDNGTFRPKAAGDDVQIHYSHAELVATTEYPGSVEGVSMRIRIKSIGGTFLPDEDGELYSFDLVAPTLQSAVIRSNNEYDFDWAKLGNTITVTLIAPSGDDAEDLGSSSLWSATIQDISAIVAGSARTWTVSSEVINHEEGPVTFSIIYYDAYRNAGSVLAEPLNSSLSVTIDKTAPVVSATIISDDNDDNASTLAKVGDEVTLTIIGKDESGGAEYIQVPTVEIMGYPRTFAAGTLTPNVAATSFTAIYTMQDDDDPGFVEFEISNIKDRAGNTASDLETATGNNVTFDPDVPTLSIVSISSNNSTNNAYAKAGEIVTIEFTAAANEPLQTPVVTIDGEATTEAQDGNNYTWTATKTMDAEDNEGQDIVFNITFKDLAANEGVAISATLDETSVWFDNTAPDLDPPVLASTNTNPPANELATTNDVITITIESDEPLYSIKDAAIAGQDVADQTTVATNDRSWEVGHTVLGTEADGYASYAYTAVDLAGNTTTVTSASSIIRIDNTPPVLNTIEISSNNVINGVASPTWASDNATDPDTDDGDEVTVTIVANEALIGAPTITIGGRGDANVTITNVGSDSKTYTGVHEMDDTDTEGLVSFTIAFQNIHGISGTPIEYDKLAPDANPTTNSSSVTYDMQAPTLSAVSISTDNVINSAYAKAGSIITLAFTAADAENLLADPTVKILHVVDAVTVPDNNLNVAAVSGSGSSWEASYTAATTNREGPVAFTIDFLDYAGNIGTQVDAIISGTDAIFDETVPTLNPVSITSSNTNAPAGTLAKPEDVITLSITADDNMQTPIITIAGHKSDVEDSGVEVSGTSGGSVYTATYTMKSSDEAYDAIPFKVDFKDLAGNEGVQVVELEGDDTEVSYDKQGPSFEIVKIEALGNDVGPSDDDDHTRAKIGDVITITLQSSEDLNTSLDPTVTIAGNTADVSRSSDNNIDFTATYTMSSSDAVHDGDPISFEITKETISDPSGNIAAEDVDATIGGSEVIFDMTAPNLDPITIASEHDGAFARWAKAGDDITVTITSTEDLQASPSVSILGSDVVFEKIADYEHWEAIIEVGDSDTQGDVDFTITYDDFVGNSGDAKTSVTAGGGKVTVDRLAPTITKADIASSNGGGTRPELAVPNDIITLTVNTSQNIQEPTITIATNPADVVIGADATIWTATYQMIESDANGAVPFTISFSDSAGNPLVGTSGNSGEPWTTIYNDEDGLNITFSKTKPTLSSILFYSDNSGHTDYANNESLLTLTFNSTEPLIQSTILIEINGDDVTPSPTLAHNGSYESWAATYDLDEEGNDAGDHEDELIPFTINFDATNGMDGDPVTEEDIDDGVTYDETAPVATILTIASNNDNVTSMCKVSDSVTVTFEAGEILQEPTILIAGKATAEVVGGTAASWTGTYKMLESDEDGILSISVAFMDYAGNSGETALAKLSGDNVTFDKTAPTLSTVTISSSNKNPDRATTADVITLKIIADNDPLHSSPTFTIAGDAVVPTTGDNGTTWEGTYIMQDDDTEAVVAFSIVFYDMAGNLGATAQATLDETSVTFDKSATVMTGVVVALDSGSDTGVDDEDDLTNDVTPTFTVTGLGLAITDSIYLVIDGTTYAKDKAVSTTLSLTSTALDENILGYPVSVKSIDLAGNESDLSPALIVKVDTTPWDIATVPNLLESDDRGFENDDDITNITQPNLILSGLPAVEDSIRLFYNIGAGDVLCGAYRMSQGTLDTVMVSSVLSDNDYDFTYIMIDSAGNESSESLELTVTVDATSPSQPATPDLTSETDSGVSDSDDITKNSDIGFSVASLDIGDRLYLKADGVSLDDDVYDSNDIISTTEVINISAAVSAEYTAFSMDIAGNQSIASSGLTVNVDTVLPNVTNVEIDLASGSDSGTKDDDDLTNDYTPEFSVSSLTVTDSVYLHVNDVFNQRLKATSTTMSITTDSLVEGSNVISIFARDLAGNLSIVSDKTLTINMDTQPPTISTSAPDLLVADDAGFDSTDNITNNSSPRFELIELPSTQLDSIRLFYNTGTGDVLSKADSMSQVTTDTIQVGSPLGAGTYSFTYVILDSAGNVSNTSPALSLVVDVSPPSVPNLADLVDDSDKGKSSTDNLTNMATPEFTVAGILEGNLASLYYIDVAGDTTLIDTQFVSSESVTFTTSALDSGIYTFYPVASDTAGNEREGADLDVIIDPVIPTSIISFDGDSLVRFGDVQTVATFEFTEILDDATNPPTVNVDYPEGTSNDLTAQTLTNVNATTWSYDIPLNTSGLEDIDGVIALTLSASDLAGNIIPVDSITGLSVLRVDNTTPVFSSFSPDTGAFINSLNIFGWTLSETIESGSVAFEQKSGPGADVTVILDATELVADVHAPNTFTAGDAALTDSTIYDIIYTSVDTAGNIGLDTIANVSYDITAPIVTLTFDQLAGSDSLIYSSEDSVILVTATWDERALPTPIINVDYSGQFNDISDATMINNGDSTIWTYPITIPGGEVNNGNVLFTITGTDLAINAFDPATLVMVDTLVVDNNKPTVTFTYSNVSQPTLDEWKRGKAGDIIDITATFSEPTHLINEPIINIEYATDFDENVEATTSSNDDSVWVFRATLLPNENNTGYITITSDATDRAGNTIGTYVDGAIFQTDNTLPVFPFTEPDSGTYVNHTLVGYQLSESVKSGSITWTRLSGNVDANSPHVIPFDATEIVGGELFRDYPLINGPDSLVSETYYQVKFSATDSSNNQSIDFIETPVYYDTTGSSVTVTFSQLFVSADSTVTITATFNERVLPTPLITLDFAGAFNDITDSLMTIADNDSSIWTLTTQIPSGIENQGNVGVSITAMDLATNTLDTIIITDTLYVDNTEPVADFTYINISQEDSVGNVGIGDDVIQVTVQMNEPIIVYDPIPSLNYTYAGTTGNSVNGVIAQSSSNGDSVWVFQITLQDTVHNDGPLNITLVAKDRSNNDVTNFTNNTLFQVDNKHPADFAVGASTVFGNNAVQGWINGKTDSVGVVIPIQTNSEDSTLFLGGYTKIQFYNLTRGVAWVTVGTQDSLTQAGVDEIFYRTIVEIEAAMPPNSDLILGDSLEIRASITDRNGNLTHGTASTQKLVYDPVAPVVGQINGGNMFTADTLYSNDTLSIQWSEFTDEGDDASGFDEYQLAFEKLGSDSLEDFYGWDSVGPPTVPLEYGLFLEHNEKYIGHVRGFDIAGNISDTLVTDTLVRYNTKPTIATLIDAALDEDISWTETLALTDPDLFVMQSDSFTYKAITTRLVGDAAIDSVTIDTSGVLTWTPTQNDTGTYEIQVIATDAYALADTFKLPLVVTAVNDTPVVDILLPDNNLEWIEDDTATVKINLTSYLEDIDNNDSTEITWQAIILDTTQLDEDFPLGRVVVGPGTPWNVHSNLLREYLGFDLNPKGMKSPVISRRTANQINTTNNMSNPLLSVTINTISSGESWAYFNSDSNYYGSDHRVIFIAQDPYGAEDRDTVMVTVLPKNDAPIISEIPLMEVTENDSIYLEFGSFTTDVDDEDLTFTISATTNEDKISISPSTYISNAIGDSVLFLPEKLWSQEATIKVIVTDNEEASDTATFILDILRVPRPEIKVAVVQNNAFSNYLQVIVSDTVSKTKFISLEIQNEDIDLDTIAAFTWAGNFNFSTAGNYSIDVLAIADVGDTVVTELIALAAAREASRWFGRSVDGRFSVAGDPGAVSYDQSFIIVDSSLFADDFNDQASYVLGDEFFEFGKPIEVRFGSQRDDLAIYRRKNGVTWEELPSISKDGEIFTFSERTGYFKLGPKTIIVPEETNIHQNYPNPFNPITTIMYDIGLMEGLSQNVSITIYNLLGQHVKTLIHDKDQVGQFTVQWNGQNEFGQPMSTGVYFVQLTTKTGIVKNKKMMLLK